MGSHTNYYFLVLELLRLKDELHRIKSPRLQPLVDLLKSKSIECVDGCEEVPSNKELAEELRFKVARTNSMLKQLLEKLYEDFEYSPLEVTQVIHKVIIMYDYDEQMKLQKNNPDLLGKSLFIDLQLKETPRIGEQIEIEVVPGERFNRGIVHEVTHKLQGKTQIIEIRCHPYKSIFYNWVKQKDEYEDNQRWLKYTELMKEMQR